jgi:hypothetical protein
VKGAVVGWASEPGEANGSSEELAALVKIRGIISATAHAETRSLLPLKIHRPIGRTGPATTRERERPGQKIVSLKS